MSDLISKSAAQAIPPLPKCYREYATSNLDDAYDKGWADALFSLNALPTIDLSEQAKHDIATIIEHEMDMRVIADRKHGKWELVGSTTMGDPFGELAWGGMYRCSECGYVRHFITEHFKFCPNCGAQLEIK